MRKKMHFLLIFFTIFPQFSTSRRELFIQRACRINPNLAFCQKFASTTTPTPTQRDNNDDVFLRWAMLAAKDSRDIEDLAEVDELETTRRRPASVQEYCTKYLMNYKAYCSTGKLEVLEGLLARFCVTFKKTCDSANENENFPTPKPFPAENPSTDEPTSATARLPNFANIGDATGDYCRKFSDQHSRECKSQGFISDDFCQSYEKSCIQKATTKTTTTTSSSAKNEETKMEIDSLEEFDSKEDEIGKKETIVEGQGASSNETSSTSSDKSLYLYKGTKKEYCDKFSVNYEYYCKGTIENAEIFTKFCPSFKKACLNDSSAPANPFSGSAGQRRPASSSKPDDSNGDGDGDSDFPDFDNPKSAKPSREDRPIKKKKACTADCDEKIYPHCTTECKCDYAYPRVQKFCNPPPLPLFLNTCRLWYYGCPKYEQYHYASQFVYSKAEKGKVLEGPKTSTTFQLLSPSGGTLPYKPSRRIRRSTTTDDVVFWPNNHREADVAVVKKILVLPPPLPKNLDARDQTIPDKNTPPSLPRVKKTTGGQAVPVFSDSVFTNALSEYNTLTDSRGILHRPRSRSPFTKPGLWEPNPDDPHNRDHANKYWYHPESVNIDWLQGQLAWGAHWAVPAAGAGGTDGFSAVHFPSIGTFLNIPDDYD